MAEETKEKLLEVEAVRQRIADLRTRVGEMAEYIKVGDRRAKLADLEAQQASADFWNNQAKAREVIAATNAERAYVVPFDALLKTVEDAAVMLELAEMEEGEAQQAALKDTLAECAKADDYFGKLRLQSLLGGKLISSSLKPLEEVIVMCWSFPVPKSLALTFTMPLASMSNVTSICGTPRGAAGIPSRLKLPKVRFWSAISRSPCNTWIVTAVWPSAAVENTWLFFVGIVVLRLMSFVITPPIVSIPKESGVTSSKTTSFTSPCKTPP